MPTIKGQDHVTKKELLYRMLSPLLGLCERINRFFDYVIERAEK